MKGEIDDQYIKMTWDNFVSFWRVVHKIEENTHYSKKWFTSLYKLDTKYKHYKFEDLVLVRTTYMIEYERTKTHSQYPLLDCICNDN